ncbi:MAG: hypothetical protein WDN26_11480 [Chitinophagaceae bacterium]
MESQHNSLFDLHIDENAKQSLKGTAVTAGIAAILSLIVSIVGVIKFFVDKSRTGYENFGETGRVQSATNLFSVIISLVITILLFYFLNRFSTYTKNGINASNAQSLNEGLGGLANYFKTMGILLIIVIILAFLAILVIGLGSK